MPNISEARFEVCCFTHGDRRIGEKRIWILDGSHLKLKGDRKITSRVDEAGVGVLLLRSRRADRQALRFLFFVLVGRIPARPNRDYTDDQSRDDASQGQPEFIRTLFLADKDFRLRRRRARSRWLLRRWGFFHRVNGTGRSTYARGLEGYGPQVGQTRCMVGRHRPTREFAGGTVFQSGE